MFSKSLASFIKKQAEEGYDIESIRKYLRSYGYHDKDIENAINSLYQPNKINFKRLILIIIVLLVIIGGSFYMLKPKRREIKPEISLNLELSSKELMPGDALRFNIELSSTVTRRYILDIEYSVLYRNSLLVKGSKKTEFSKKGLLQESLKLPDKIGPGEYVLEVKVSYDSRVESKTDAFRVIGKPAKDNISIRECPLTCNDNDECTEDKCSEETGFKCVNTQVIPCCGNHVCEPSETFDSCEVDCRLEEKKKEEAKEELVEGLTIWEKVENVKSLSLTDIEKAEGFCNELNQLSHKEQCFTNIAESRKDIKYCEYITNNRSSDNCYSTIAKLTNNSQTCEMVSEIRSDYCYMPFVMDGDYSVCPKLKNKYLKQSCETLSRVRKKENE